METLLDAQEARQIVRFIDLLRPASPEQVSQPGII